MDTPAQALGTWIAEKRKAAGYVISQAAGMLLLGPAKYTELECGIGKWLSTDMAKKLAKIFNLDSKDCIHLTTLHKKAMDADLVAFDQVFTRDMLEPVRLRRYSKKRVTETEKEEILKQVFTPTV